MRLLILGATGGIGQHLIRFALANGHEATAFVRSPRKITLTHERLKVVAGDLLNREQLTRVLPGHDIVLSAFGPATLRATTTRGDFSHALATAVQDSGVRRVLLVSSALLFPKTSLLGAFLRTTILGNLIPDTTVMEAAIRQDGLDWTIVRPPRLTNGPLTHKFRVTDGILPKSGTTISRADVADFMIGEAESPAHIRQIVGVAS